MVVEKLNSKPRTYYAELDNGSISETNRKYWIKDCSDQKFLSEHTPEVPVKRNKRNININTYIRFKFSNNV